jgi:hypothetical protein
MAKQITITNGTGSEAVGVGNYTVSATVTGYDNSSINPSSVSIETSTSDYAFTISANGTLTIHVTDTGTSEGNPIVGATFYRTDSTGNTYGNVITTNSQGNAVFNNVPYDTSGFTVYYKQTASDGNHDFNTAVASTSLTSSTSTLELQNPAFQTYNFTLNDANYENMPIDSGTITLS